MDDKDLINNLQRFYHEQNGILAGKENFKLVATFKKLRKGYYNKWSHESNLYFMLLVRLKRRQANLTPKTNS